MREFIEIIKLMEAESNDLASRLARAKEMGFDVSTVYYHGTPLDRSIDSLQRGEWERVTGEPCYFDNMERNPNSHRWVPAPPEKQQIWFTPNPKYADSYARRGNTHGGAIYPVFLRADAIRHPKHPGLIKSEVYVTDPSAIRSIHAMFDPARAGDSDLLA